MTTLYNTTAYEYILCSKARRRSCACGDCLNLCRGVFLIALVNTSAMVDKKATVLSSNGRVADHERTVTILIHNLKTK
uniref:Uncharacterized protein n=1 Tax=Ascaris lumbricoides TaxID=6252 RepID=A0A0M3IX39_ASCLU